MTDHTPEPWGNESKAHGKTNYADAVVKSLGYVQLDEKDWERAKACVRACAGIPTEQLGNVKALAEAAGAALQYIYLAYVQEGQAKRDELAGIAKRDFDALDAALAPFRRTEP